MSVSLPLAASSMASEAAVASLGSALAEAEIRARIESDLAAQGVGSSEIASMKVARFAQTTDPYVVWDADVMLSEGPGTWVYQLDAFTGGRLATPIPGSALSSGLACKRDPLWASGSGSVSGPKQKTKIARRRVFGWGRSFAALLLFLSAWAASLAASLPAFASGEVGTGIGLLGDAKGHIDTVLLPSGEYVLRDISRVRDQTGHSHNGDMQLSHPIETVLMSTGLPFSDSDNIWDSGDVQSAAIDAHVYAAVVYDYLWNEHGLSSYDGQRSGMVSFVGTISSEFCEYGFNAWYNSGRNEVAYCGQVDDFFCELNSGCYGSFSGGLDVVAHEWAHALTDRAPNGTAGSAREGTLAYRSWSGALNEAFSDWMGAAVDPEAGIIYIPSATIPSRSGLAIPPEEDATLNYVRNVTTNLRPRGLPLIKPPYGRITAIDLNVGEILWQVANGIGSPTVRNHSALAGVDLPPLGNGWDQVLVTKTLLISAQRTPNEGGSYPLVARDKLTGDTIAELALPAQPIGPPVTYLNNGQQQIAVTISGTPPELLVVGLP